jgi:hypothetical protein
MDWGFMRTMHALCLMIIMTYDITIAWTRFYQSGFGGTSLGRFHTLLMLHGHRVPIDVAWTWSACWCCMGMECLLMLHGHGVAYCYCLLMLYGHGVPIDVAWAWSCLLSLHWHEDVYNCCIVMCVPCNNAMKCGEIPFHTWLMGIWWVTVPRIIAMGIWWVTVPRIIAMGIWWVTVPRMIKEYGELPFLKC